MKKSRYIFLLVILIGLSLAYFYLPTSIVSPFRNLVSRVASPLQKILYSGGQGTRNFFSDISDIKNLRTENNDLQLQVADLVQENAALKEVKAENDLLKKEIEVRGGVVAEDLLLARIIGREPSSFLQFFSVDQGESSGVKVGQAATFEGVLVGRVTKVTLVSSQITLVLSSHSIVQAELQDSRTLGIVKGGLQGIYLDNIPQDEPFKIGELVVTSGLGGDLPKGIIIGKVDKVTTPKSEIFQTFSLTTPLDFNKIETVFILK